MADEYLSPKCVEREFGESKSKKKFYPIGVRTFFKLKPLVGPLVLAFAELMRDSKLDVSVTTRDFREDTTGRTGTEIVQSAIDERLAGRRADDRRAALQRAMDAVFDMGAANSLAEVFMDSLRDEAAHKDKADAAKVTAFCDRLDAPTFMSMLSAVIEVNRDLFDPLLEALAPGLMVAVKAKIKAKVGADEKVDEKKPV